MTTDAVEWRIDAASSRGLRWAVYVSVGLLGGGWLLAVGALLLTGVGSALTGDVALLALVGVFALVGGPLSLVYLWPAIRDPAKRPPLSMLVPDPADDPEETLAERYVSVFSIRRLVLASLVGAIVIFVLVVLDPRTPVVLAICAFVLLPVASGVVSWGRIDPTDRKLSYGTSVIPLDDVERVRRLRAGGLVVCWLSYRSRSKTVSTPSFLALTPAAATTLEGVVARTEETDPTTGTRSASERAIRLVAIGIGLSTLALGLGVWFVDGVETSIAIYASVVGGLLGLLFVWAGVTLT